MSKPSFDKLTTITVAIISDTHAFLDSRVSQIVDDADIAVHAGDIGDAEVLLKMRPKSGRVIAVAGNNDHPVLWPKDQIESLETIPELAYFDLPGGRVVVEHGDKHDRITPDHQSLRDAHPGVRLVIYGHTHKLVVDENELPWVANPGAAGKTRTNGGPSCLLLKASNQSWDIEQIRFAETGIA